MHRTIVYAGKKAWMSARLPWVGYVAGDVLQPFRHLPQSRLSLPIAIASAMRQPGIKRLRRL
jgi:hypothetical protein